MERSHPLLLGVCLPIVDVLSHAHHGPRTRVHPAPCHAHHGHRERAHWRPRAGARHTPELESADTLVLEPKPVAPISATVGFLMQFDCLEWVPTHAPTPDVSPSPPVLSTLMESLLLIVFLDLPPLLVPSIPPWAPSCLRLHLGQASPWLVEDFQASGYTHLSTLSALLASPYPSGSSFILTPTGPAPVCQAPVCQAPVPHCSRKPAAPP